MPTTTRFVILRATDPSTQRLESYRPGPLDGQLGTDLPTAPPAGTIEVADLSSDDQWDVAADPAVLAFAPTMPVQLIEPVAASGSGDRGSGDRVSGDRMAWGVEAIGAAASPFTGAGVTVAILDTGIDPTHPAFAGVTITARDFTETWPSSTSPSDRDGHGTHCAGTILGRAVAGERIGVAPGITRALIGKVIADDGRGESDWLLRALEWALDSGAEVVSMSVALSFARMVARQIGLGIPALAAMSFALDAYRANLRLFDAIAMQARIRRTGGAVLVAASGNDSDRNGRRPYEVAASLPAVATGVIAVGAVTRAAGGLTVAPFSNVLVQLAAPGVDIRSAWPGGGVRALDGTSMAAPHVAGAAALWWQALRASGQLATADIVTAHLLARSTTDLISGTTPAGRGVGLVGVPDEAWSHRQSFRERP